MKKLNSILAVTVILMAGTVLTSCQTPDQKVDAARDKVQDARQDLNKAQKEAYDAENKQIDAEEWKTFKSETEISIKNNELRIAELKVQLEKPGKTFDAIYKQRIETLEQKNKDMRIRLDAYEKDGTDWETFKREFNNDMNELGKALKDFTIDSKK